MLNPHSLTCPSQCVAVAYPFHRISQLWPGQKIYRFSVNFLRFAGFLKRDFCKNICFPSSRLRGFAQDESQAYGAWAIDDVTIIPHIVDKTVGASQWQKA
jgi:hypothetical protein